MFISLVLTFIFGLALGFAIKNYMESRTWL